MKNILNNSKLSREIGPFSATILVIANMVGTGIFTTSGFIMTELDSPGAMLLCWVLGGIFALSGALCYGELGAMFPHAGGEYVFLREAFGKFVAFLSGWISLIVGFSAPIAAASIACAAYCLRLFPSIENWGNTTRFLRGDVINISPVTVLALAMIVIFSIVHYHSVSFGTRVQNILTVFKILLIIVFVVTGFLGGHGSIEHFSGTFHFGSIFQEKFAVSLIFISFAYSGWNAAAYLGGEIKKPTTNIPSALIGGTLVVMVLYLSLNALYLYALSSQNMKGVLEVGATSAGALFGSNFSKYFTGAIAIGLLSVLSAMIMAGPRVYYAMAKDGVFFQLFGKVDRFHKTPAHAIFFQAGVAMLMVVTASFEKLLIYIGFTLSLCATLTVIGMLLLRLRQPEIKREYKTLGYPVTPILFIMGNLWIICFSIKSRPVASLIGLGTIGAGMLVYLCFSKIARGVNGLRPLGHGKNLDDGKGVIGKKV